ncbi:MAG: hypothetical protein HY920_05980 [Elusimicrobia bacterium]|nr:hypothetical protein [Elusimicrobiota bacterium]
MIEKTGYNRIVIFVFILMLLLAQVLTAEQWDKHRVAFSATIGGLSGGMVGAVAGYGVS